MKEFIEQLESGQLDWEESGLLEGGLSETNKEDLIKLFNIGARLIKDETDSDIQQIFLPCIRRIYAGLSNESIEGLPFVFANPESIHNVLLRSYRVVKKAMDSALTTTDTQAESTVLICDDYIRSVKELIRKDISGVRKVINREMLLDDLLG